MAMMVTYVAGVNHRPGAREHFPKLLDGEGLTLVREPSNKFDRNAVAVYDGPFHLGYVPAVDARTIAKAMDADRPVRAKVNRVTTIYGLEVEWDSE